MAGRAAMRAVKIRDSRRVLVRAAAGTLLFSGLVAAQDRPPPTTRAVPWRLEGSVDIGRLLPSFGEPRSGRPSRRSAAASLPDPRALKGANASAASRLRLNLKGFSVLEARDGADAEVRVRRVREREWRRPVLSLTFQKRF